MEQPKVVTLQLTQLEAWAVLRSLGIANESERQEREDKQPVTWAAKRLLGLLDNTHVEDRNYAKLAYWERNR